MATSTAPSIDPWHIVFDNPSAVAAVVIALVVLIIVLVIQRPLRKALESWAARGGKLPGGIELNPAAVPDQDQATAPTPAEEQTFDTVTQALLGPVFEERVRNMESRLRLLGESERYRALLVIAAREQVTSEFHRLYRLIYGSQITALKYANGSGLVPRAAFETFYRGGEERDPDFYKETSFEQWLAFLTNQILLRHEEGDRYQLTNRGQLFLHFMVQEGLSDYGLPHNARR